MQNHSGNSLMAGVGFSVTVSFLSSTAQFFVSGFACGAGATGHIALISAPRPLHACKPGPTSSTPTNWNSAIGVRFVEG